MVDIQYGVPQGSIVDPLLFILYINNLGNCSYNRLILFTDDTCLTLQDISSENLKMKIGAKFRYLLNGSMLTN